MVDGRIREYLKNDLAGTSDEIKRLRLLRKRGFLIAPYSNGKIGINLFLKGYDDADLLDCLNMDVDDIIEKLFCRDSISGHAVCWKYKDKWGSLFASNCIYGAKVKTMQLEPFMAKLVHAVSFCGMYTYYSCDGWHEAQGKNNDKAFIGFLDRNSLIWFITLLENDPDLATVKIDYVVEDHFLTFYFDEEKRFDVYNALDTISDILYQKRDQFRKQKQWVVNALKGQQKSRLLDNELKALLRQTYLRCDVVITSYSDNDWENVTEEEAKHFTDFVKSDFLKKTKKVKFDK